MLFCNSPERVSPASSETSGYDPSDSIFSFPSNVHRRRQSFTPAGSTSTDS